MPPADQRRHCLWLNIQGWSISSLSKYLDAFEDSSLRKTAKNTLPEKEERKKPSQPPTLKPSSGQLQRPRTVLPCPKAFSHWWLQTPIKPQCILPCHSPEKALQVPVIAYLSRNFSVRPPPTTAVANHCDASGRLPSPRRVQPIWVVNGADHRHNCRRHSLQHRHCTSVMHADHLARLVWPGMLVDHVHIGRFNSRHVLRFAWNSVPQCVWSYGRVGEVYFLITKTNLKAYKNYFDCKLYNIIK